MSHVEVSRALCRDLLIGAGASEKLAAQLADGWIRHADFLLSGVDLFSDDDVPAPDVVIGNPPYIRYDDFPEALAAQYRSTWPTMRGRGDIYVGFIERSLKMLAPDGRVGFICADRWMRNQYGATPLPRRQMTATTAAVDPRGSHDGMALLATIVAVFCVVAAAICLGIAVWSASTTSAPRHAQLRLVSWRRTPSFRRAQAFPPPTWRSWPTRSAN
jgi:adenine-specific DNA-methyltransferase